MNLIKKASRDDAILANYSYLADGTKLSATDAAGDGLYYAGSLVYKKQGNSLNLESAAFAGGRFIANQTSAGTIFTPQYHLTDHLGSTRVVVNADGDVLERNDYYPFGLRIDKADYEIADNRYRYNGKEEQDFVNVPFVDYGARMYDARYRMSWNAIDPKLGDYLPISPYVFCLCNPIKYNDSNGCDAKVTIDHKSKIITITANIILYPKGRGIGTDVANYYQSSILKAWDKGWKYTTEDGSKYNVKFNITVRMQHINEQRYYNGVNNYIEVIDSKIISETGNTHNGKWAKGSPNYNSAAHEFGHIVGLDDKYDLDTRVPLSGWETNIMSGSLDINGAPCEVEQRNIDMLLKDAMKSEEIIFYINFNNSEILENINNK